MLIDYHTHTRLTDGVGKPIEYAEVAIKHGLDEMGCSDHAPLNGQRFARDTRPGRGLVPAASEQAGDVAHVDAITFRAEADARQFRFELFEDASDDDRFDGADVIDESLTVGSVGPGAGEVGGYYNPPREWYATIRVNFQP